MRFTLLFRPIGDVPANTDARPFWVRNRKPDRAFLHLILDMLLTQYRYGAPVLAALFFLHAAVAPAFQQSPAPETGQTATPLPGQQLDDLVAPIALFPDSLVAQVLAASTYPIEVAEAEQWAKDHPKWKPAKLMDEVKKQKWDPSVKALVAFPNVLTMLSQSLSWTTQLGNAFLAQQADVMHAIQRMRAQAQAKGTLHSTPQIDVTTQEENGQSAIDIRPANADVWYVPYYNPFYIWGPPVWGVYPPLIYPEVGLGFGFWPGIDIGLYFGGWGGWGWGGWGWGPNWFGGGIFIDYSFFHRYGFGEFHGDIGRGAWAHDPEHRLGVAYPNRELSGRYGGGSERLGGEEPHFNRGENEPRLGRENSSRLGNPGFEDRGYTSKHSVFGGYHDGGATRMQSDHGFSSIGAGRAAGGFGGGGFGGGRRR
jgi:hypothetical protein